MSRRYVKQSKTNSLGEITPEVVAVVSAKDNLIQVTDEQKYFKRNYLDAIRQIVPKFYFSDEQDVSGVQVSFPNQVINSHVLANNNQSVILPVSALTEDMYLSSLNTPSGFAKYFYKTQAPAQITSDDFQRDILFARGVSLNTYRTSAAFLDYVSGTLLPSIPCVSPSHHAAANLATLTASAYANDSSGTYKYLVNNLGWLYFLNREGPVGGFDPSSSLAELLTDTIWRGRSIVLEDTINIYQEHLWKNQPLFAGVTDNIIPLDYVSGSITPSATWTSGTQLLDRLKTLNQVVYSPHFLNSPDNKVEDTFTNFYNTATPSQEGKLITDTQEAGPLSRFLEALSFSIGDRLTEEGELGVLYDIGRCPDEFLELLGELIGWRFLGVDVDKWRVQLRNAVEIYKMKGTARSIQYLLDTLFSTGVFNVNNKDTLSELWESYIPDMIYYALATSSTPLQGFDTYTPDLAKQFGVVNYTNRSMETNIKYIVDKILFDLVREFPQNFLLGGKPFPAAQLVLSSSPEVIWTKPYHIMGPNGHVNSSGEFVWPQFMTGSKHDASSVNLTLLADPNFIFYYRDRPYLVPPYEKRQYYTQTQVSEGMVDRIEYYLICYGVDKPFAKEISRFLKNNITNTLDVNKVINNFVIFTKEKHLPPNYDNIIRDVTSQRTPDPVSLLSLWNGKSSHFMMNFGASSFDWTTQQLTSSSRYGLSKVMRVLDQVIPAHAIPKVLLSVSNVADGLDAMADNDCREWRPNFDDLYTGSATVTTNYAISATDMAGLAVEAGLRPNRFERRDVDKLSDHMVSGNKFISAHPRNALRRRNFHNLLPETKMFTRGGKNNPGSYELSTPYYSSSIGYIPLGFIPSSLAFQGIALRQNSWGSKLGEYVDHRNVHVVWDICQNLLSPSSLFGYDVSNTFASRAKQNVATSDCNTYGRRGQLQEIMYVMNKVHDAEKMLQASSLIGGYLNENGTVNTSWPTSSTLITPHNFYEWYNIPDLDVIKSVGNHLINQESADESLHYYEHFTFGQSVSRFYNTYMSLYNGHGTTSNYDLYGVPNLFSHTYGPLIYNHNFDVNGSAIDASGYLAASSTLHEIDIAYYGGSGILGPKGCSGATYEGVGTYAASDANDVYLNKPEFRNNKLVSSIELVDTSSPVALTQHPIFSIFNLSRDDQSKYSYSKYLINNQIIKYHRGTSIGSFPRIRVNIDNSSNLASNFLEPEHEYEVTVVAHCLDNSAVGEKGGLRLGCWIHTQPEQEAIWYYNPQLAPGECGASHVQWKQVSTEELSTHGMGIAQQYSNAKPFEVGFLTIPVTSGIGEIGDGTGLPITEDIYDYRCWEPLYRTTYIPGSNPLAIQNVNEASRDTIKFKFSTQNTVATVMPPKYHGTYDKVNRTDQAYTLEFFALAGSDTKFIVFESISIQDITNYNKAVIETKYGDARIDASDLKAVFRYFKTLSNGIASRNQVNTSATMEVSGGSRLNYRANINMFESRRDGDYGALSYLNINEG